MGSGCLCYWRRLLFLGLLLSGCSWSQGSIEIPEWDPAEATERALSGYDSSGDHQLSREELKRCPGLLSAIGHFDRDGDRSISAQELKSALQEIDEDQTAMVKIACTVTRSGQPLEGATVTFVPESFMGEQFKPAIGVTEGDGTTYPTSDAENLPEEYRGRVHGIHGGVYRVEVTHPNVDIPAKYNTQTELGRTVTGRKREQSVTGREREQLIINL